MFNCDVTIIHILHLLSTPEISVNCHYFLCIFCIVCRWNFLAISFYTASMNIHVLLNPVHVHLIVYSNYTIIIFCIMMEILDTLWFRGFEENIALIFFIVTTSILVSKWPNGWESTLLKKNLWNCSFCICLFCVLFKIIVLFHKLLGYVILSDLALRHVQW